MNLEELSTFKVANSLYSRLALSRLRLSRVTAYLELKNLVHVLRLKSKNRLQNIVEKRKNSSEGASSLFNDRFYLSFFVATHGFRDSD